MILANAFFVGGLVVAFMAFLGLLILALEIGGEALHEIIQDPNWVTLLCSCGLLVAFFLSGALYYLIILAPLRWLWMLL